VCSKRNKFNKFLYIILILVPFFLNIKTIKAVKSYEMEIGRVGLFSDCNESTKCVPLCIYSCDNDSSECHYANLNNNGDYAYIGYYYGESDDRWSMGLIESVSTPTGKDAFLYSWNDYYLPKTDIHFESGKNQEWSETNVYNEVNEKFLCPIYLYNEPTTGEGLEDILKLGIGFVSPFSDYDLCFANKRLNNCSLKELELGNIISDTIRFGLPTTGGNIVKELLLNNEYNNPKTLTYNFVDEFKQIVDDTYITLIPLINKKDPVEMLDFIKGAGYHIKENENLEEQHKQVCKLLDGKDTTKVVKELSEDYYIENVVNQQLLNSANKMNSRNKTFYSYQNIMKLLINGYDENNQPIIRTGIVDASGITYYDKINNIYINKLVQALEFYDDRCSSLGYDLDYDVTEIEEIQKQKKLGLLGRDPIGFEELNCENLFAGGLAELIGNAYFLIEIAAVAILIILTVLDYGKAILNGEADEIKKVNQKLIKRIIIVFIIFLLPAIVNFVLRLFNIEGFNSENPLCVKIKR